MKLGKSLTLEQLSSKKNWKGKKVFDRTEINKAYGFEHRTCLAYIMFVYLKAKNFFPSLNSKVFPLVWIICCTLEDLMFECHISLLCRGEIRKIPCFFTIFRINFMWKFNEINRDIDTNWISRVVVKKCYFKTQTKSSIIQYPLSISGWSLE